MSSTKKWKAPPVPKMGGGFSMGRGMGGGLGSAIPKNYSPPIPRIEGRSGLGSKQDLSIPRSAGYTVSNHSSHSSPNVSPRATFDIESRDITVKNPLGLDVKEKITPPKYAGISKSRPTIAPNGGIGRAPGMAPTSDIKPSNPKNSGRKVSKAAIGVMISVLVIAMIVGVSYMILGTANQAVGTTVLSVSPSGGIPPYTYQWSTGGSCNNPLLGQTSNTLNLTGSMGTYYSVNVVDNELPALSTCTGFAI